MRCRRPALASAFAVVVLVVGQLLALAHEAASRHVVCAEHGESIEAVSLEGADDGCAQSHWIGVEGDASGEHVDCAITHVLHQTGVAPTAAPLAPLADLIAPPAFEPAALAVDATSSLYRIAPKTSPPHAG